MQILSMDNIPRADREKLQGEEYRDVLEELEASRSLCAKLDQIIEHTPDGIYVTDGEANAIRINPAFERISGLNRSKMLGVNHTELERYGIVARSSSLMAIKQRKTVTIIHADVYSQAADLRKEVCAPKMNVRSKYGAPMILWVNTRPSG